MVPRSSDDGEMRVLRVLAEQAQTQSVQRGLEAPMKVVGALPPPAAMLTEIIRRAAAVGLDPAVVDAQLRPYPERIDFGTQPWPPELVEIVRTVRVDYDSHESADHRAARIATTLEGAVVTNDDDCFTAYFRVPKRTTDIEDPLLLLHNATWLMDVLDEQRRTLVAAARAQGRSWADIALALGVTRASAWQRYSSPDE